MCWGRIPGEPAEGGCLEGWQQVRAFPRPFFETHVRFRVRARDETAGRSTQHA